MLRCFSNALYDEYDSWVSSLHPVGRKDFVLFAIVSAIDYYDPSRENLVNTQLIKHERDIFYKILQKYLISKLGQKWFDERFAGCSLPEKLQDRFLTKAHIIKDLYESVVLSPKLGLEISAKGKECQIFSWFSDSTKRSRKFMKRSEPWLQNRFLCKWFVNHDFFRLILCMLICGELNFLG